MLDNISLDTEAVVTNSAGVEVSAQSVICENKFVIIAGLDALKAMIKNPIVKLIVGTLISVVESVVLKYCK